MKSQKFIELQQRHTRLLDRQEDLDPFFTFEMGDHIDIRREGYEEAVDMLLAGYISIELFTNHINTSYEQYLQALEDSLDELELEEEDS